MFLAVTIKRKTTSVTEFVSDGSSSWFDGTLDKRGGFISLSV